MHQTHRNGTHATLFFWKILVLRNPQTTSVMQRKLKRQNQIALVLLRITMILTKILIVPYMQHSVQIFISHNNRTRSTVQWSTIATIATVANPGSKCTRESSMVGAAFPRWTVSSEIVIGEELKMKKLPCASW